MLVGRRLWDQYSISLVLDKVMGANVGHDLCTGEDFGMELLLDLVSLLCGSSVGQKIVNTMLAVPSQCS